MRTSSLKSTDAAHSRSTSAPWCLITSFGLDGVAERLVHRLALAVEHPAVQRAGAVRRSALDARCPPAASCGTSRDTGRRLPGTGRPARAGRNRSFSTARWLEPESNHTSRMSVSLLNSVPPHLAHVVPGGQQLGGGCVRTRRRRCARRNSSHDARPASCGPSAARGSLRNRTR